jgi:hypothetical protein
MKNRRFLRHIAFLILVIAGAPNAASQDITYGPETTSYATRADLGEGDIAVQRVKDSARRIVQAIQIKDSAIEIEGSELGFALCSRNGKIRSEISDYLEGIDPLGQDKKVYLSDIQSITIDSIGSGILRLARWMRIRVFLFPKARPDQLLKNRLDFTEFQKNYTSDLELSVDLSNWWGPDLSIIQNRGSTPTKLVAFKDIRPKTDFVLYFPKEDEPIWWVVAPVATSDGFSLKSFVR